VNTSENIRSLISLPLTAHEIHAKMPEVDLKLIRGCIQRMVATGIVRKIGESRPYSYQLARKLKRTNRGF